MIITISAIITSFYLACGLVFAMAFVVKGVQRVDEGARGASVGFRIIIIPGTMVFWPVLLKKWIAAAGKDKQHD